MCQGGSTKLDYISLVIAFIAAGIALFALFETKSQHSDQSYSELIRESYSDFVELTDLQVNNWQVAYLFSLRDRYCEVRNLASLSLDLKTHPHKAAEILLKEQGTADKIFTMFEHAYYQWAHAKNVEDETRTKFLEEVLNYYTRRLLRNPRLIWYWSKDGGNLRKHFEDVVRRYYQSKVITPLKGKKVLDAKGLFPDSTPKEDFCQPNET